MMPHQLGPDGDVKIARTGKQKLLLDAVKVHIKGALSAPEMFIDGIPLTKYIAVLVAQVLKEEVG